MHKKSTHLKEEKNTQKNTNKQRPHTTLYGSCDIQTIRTIKQNSRKALCCIVIRQYHDVIYRNVCIILATFPLNFFEFEKL